MSNDADKDAKTEQKKSKLGLILGVAGAAVVLVAGGVTGLVLGPEMLGSASAEAATGGGANAASGRAAGEKANARKPGQPEKVVSFKFDPIIVDVLSKFGESHHLKVGLAAELAEGTAEAELRLVQPRGREAAITYLRSLTYEEVTSPKKYGRIKKDLIRKVTVAVGEERVSRVLVIDFVAQ